MKKLTILSILLSLCMFSCDVSETEVNEGGGGSGGTASPKDVGKKLTSAPSEAEAASMVSEVSVAVAKAGATAEPGSKAWCDIVAEVLKKANGLLLNGDNYTDANLKAQIEVLKQNISKCESNQEVTSFDWYKEGKEEAVKEVGTECSIPSGLKIQELYDEVYRVVMASEVVCESLSKSLGEINARYPLESQYLDLMESTCSAASNVPCSFNACVEEWRFKNVPEADRMAFELKLAEINAKCIYGMNLDPCAKKVCNVGEFCSSGECVDACSVLNCGADATCSKGFCIPNNPEQPAKTCTEDPSICNGGQCVNGQCQASQQPASIDCNAYPKTKEALVNAILNASSCQDLDNKLDDILPIAASEGINDSNREAIQDACTDKWTEGIVIEINGDPNAFNVFKCEYFDGVFEDVVIGEGKACSDSSQCGADEECNKVFGVCMPKEGVISTSCVQDPSICKSDEVCDPQSGACVPKGGVGNVTCIQDPSICKSDEACDPQSGACVPKQVSGNVCDNYPQTKAEFLNVMKTFKTCADLESGDSKLIGIFVSEGGNAEDYDDLGEECVEEWAEDLGADILTVLDRLDNIDWDTCTKIPDWMDFGGDFDIGF